MTEQATGTLRTTSWRDERFADLEAAPKLTHDWVTHSLSGDIEGDGTSELLNFYRDDSSATYFGFERVVGRLANRGGSFVLQSTGVYEGGVATTTWSVVAGSGTGELKGLRGDGGYEAKAADQEYSYRLDYHFE